MKAGFLLRFLRYYFTAGTRHAAHSPFVYALVDEVICKDEKLHIFQPIEAIRKKMLADRTVIKVDDYGAGSSSGIYKKRSIHAVARHSSKPERYCRLLYRLVNYFKPAVMLELGTSLGISALYQAAGNSAGKLITIEGSESIAAKAEENFRMAGRNNIKLLKGEFDSVLPGLLEQLPALDYIFIDGNHRKKATLDYFDQCLKKSHEKTIFVIDDINWSNDMMEAWQQIKQHEKVTVTVDLFMMGLVFLNPDLSKEDFVIRY